VHRIHHSVIVAEGNRNFGNLFTWWDYLFATYQAEPRGGHERMELGIREARAPADVTLWRLLAMPFRRPHIVAATPSTGEELCGSEELNFSNRANVR